MGGIAFNLEIQRRRPPVNRELRLAMPADGARFSSTVRQFEHIARWYRRGRRRPVRLAARARPGLAPE